MTQLPNRKRRKDAGIPRVPKDYPDETIAAKLNRGNPDERKVLEWWDYWQTLVGDDGKPLNKRRILVWVTSKAAGEELPTSTGGGGIADMIQRFQQQLDQLALTVERLQEMGVAPETAKKKKAGPKSKVDAGYLQNLMKAIHGEDEE